MAVLGVALALIGAGLTWLLGAFGLIIIGSALAALVLFGVNVEERPRGEPVPELGAPPWARSEP